MAKKHHWGRKDRPQRVCNPDTCPNCMYVGEGDSWCDKIGKIVLSDWSLQSITWGAARKEKKSDRIRDFQNYFEVASDYGSELCNWGAHCV